MGAFYALKYGNRFVSSSLLTLVPIGKSYLVSANTWTRQIRLINSFRQYFPIRMPVHQFVHKSDMTHCGIQTQGDQVLNQTCNSYISNVVARQMVRLGLDTGQYEISHSIYYYLRCALHWAKPQNIALSLIVTQQTFPGDA